MTDCVNYCPLTEKPDYSMNTVKALVENSPDIICRVDRELRHPGWKVQEFKLVPMEVIRWGLD